MFVFFFCSFFVVSLLISFDTFTLLLMSVEHVKSSVITSATLFRGLLTMHYEVGFVVCGSLGVISEVSLGRIYVLLTLLLGCLVKGTTYQP